MGINPFHRQGMSETRTDIQHGIHIQMILMGSVMDRINLHSKEYPHTDSVQPASKQFVTQLLEGVRWDDDADEMNGWK